MPTPNKNYRENPKRAVYISGKIDQALVDKITPTINELRFENTDPITAYIDSFGGSILLAETIRQHITAPNHEGRRCRLITVVTSRAASAAADLLALGDYAIAYPYGDVVYHGSSQPGDISLTAEMATATARSLQQTNEFCAVRLARHAFARFVLRLTQLKDEFSKYVNEPDLLVLTRALSKNLSPANARLVREARTKQGIIANLSGSVIKHVQRFKKKKLSNTEFECEMLAGIVKYRLQFHKRHKESWLLSESGLQEVTEDFNLLHDFHFGSQKRELEKWDKTYGEIFLSDKEKEEQKTLTGTEDDKTTWLITKSEPKLRPIWYLMVSVCRLLQGRDYTIPADEAYWLGLVDEVPGSGLPCLRQAEENLPAKSAV